MVTLNSIMSIIILNINGISNPIKYKHCLLEWIKTTKIATISKKQALTLDCLQR